MSAELPVLFILSNGRDMGGAERSIAALLPHLGKAARTYILPTNHRHTEELLALSARNVKVLPGILGLSPAAQFLSLIRLVRLCREHRPQTILANGHRGCFLLFWLRFIPLPRRPRCVVYVRDFAYSTLRFTLWAMRDFLFLAPTQAIFDFSPYQSWGLSRRQHRVIPNAVAETNPPSEPQPGQLRFIGCCARLVPWKGIDFLIRAFALVVKASPEARLRIYGERIDPAYFASLQSMTDELGLARHIEFCDFATDMRAVFQQGLFFVIPSLSMLPGPESFCRIIIEAWSYQRPVIAFATGGPLHLIEDGVDGFLVEERHIGQLAGRISGLLGDPERARRMGRAGWEKVRAQFSPENISRELLTCLLPASAASATPASATQATASASIP